MAAAAIRHEETLAWPAFGRYLVELGSDIQRSAALAVALDEALAERLGRGASPPILRIWTNGRAVVLPRSRLRGRGSCGVIDRCGREWPLCARASGGAAVAHGPGTLNMSVILPLRGQHEPSIDGGYRLWIAILDAALRDTYDVAVNAARVERAFCNGRYDAVADGRKLAGIAQARRNGSVLVHGTILIDIDRTEYLRLIGAAEQLVGISNPHGEYDPEQIVSLHELTGRVVPAEEVALAIGRAAATISHPRGSLRRVSPTELARARQIAASNRTCSCSDPWSVGVCSFTSGEARATRPPQESAPKRSPR